MTRDRQETTRPRRNVHYVVQIDGAGAAMRFQEASGLDVDSQLADYRAGRSKSFASRRLPGTAKPGSVTLRRGIVAKNDKFSEWQELISQNKVQRATLTIRLLDESGSSLAVWTLANALPRKITGPDLNAQANEVAIETIELEHEGLTIADDDGDD